MRVGRRALALAATLLLAPAHAAEMDLLEVTTTSALTPTSQTLMVARATFGAELPRISSTEEQHATPTRLVAATMSADCSRCVVRDTVATPRVALLMDRGDSGCSFVQQALAAQRSGAALLAVTNSVSGAFHSAQQSALPYFDCSLGQAAVSRNASIATFPTVPSSEQSICVTDSRCASSTCVFTGQAAPHDKGFQVCCFQDELVRMGVDIAAQTLAADVSIPAVFLRLTDAKGLRALMTHTDVMIHVVNAEENPWNLAMVLTWALGVVVVVGGAYSSSTEERRFSYQKVARAFMQQHAMEGGYISIDDDKPTPPAPSTARLAASSIKTTPHVGVHPVVPQDLESDDGDSLDRSGDDRLELSPKHALFFAVGSSGMLLLLYYGHLALTINVLFMVATTGSLTQVVVLPVLLALLPTRVALCFRQSLVLVAVALAAAVSIYWFLHRASASIWPLQDLLCVSLCFVVIDSIQLPNLKVATALLGTAFCYDIFFVYISPLIFGSSVMIDVAAGGANVQEDQALQSATHEKIPMVLSVPLLFSYYGGNALLGLGDLILPGLLVSFCIRYDYCMAYPLSRRYFAVSSVAYAVGLLLANAMAIALRDVVKGQPALMYIVPLTLGSVCLMAYCRGELKEMWEGPECLDMQFQDQYGAPPRREELEPFLKQK
ncbi:hypothetical protein PINS_up000622 [Pythium insidiosum]|nr:hypothetical protein PINS_up000622 [Pythium insidiosum]